MLTVFLLLLCVNYIRTTYPCTKITLDDGTAVDISPIVNKYYSVDVTTYAGHHLTWTYGVKMNSGHLCEFHTDTHGPTVGKDVYKPGQHCWYVGPEDVSQCTISQYYASSQTFTVNYPGLTDPTGHKRHIHTTFHCDPSAKGQGIGRCDDAESIEDATTFMVDIYSEYACPRSNTPNGWGVFFSVVGILTLVCCLVGGFVAIIVAIVVVVVLVLQKRRGMADGKPTRHAYGIVGGNEPDEEKTPFVTEDKD